jgi:hypothetical protein
MEFERYEYEELEPLPGLADFVSFAKADEGEMKWGGKTPGSFQPGDQAFLGRTHSEKTKKKISESVSYYRQNNEPSEETRRGWGHGRGGKKGRKQTPEEKAKQIAAQTGKKRGPYKNKTAYCDRWQRKLDNEAN